MPDARRIALALCLLAPAATSVRGAEPAPAALAASIDGMFAPVAGKPMPGAAVLVLRDGAVVHAKGYGLANVASGEANSTTTRFRLASVTKPFTALAVLQLAEQGRLSLDDSLERYVPGFVGGERIRLRHLLSHTAGLPDFMSVEQAMKLPPDGAPGERMNYSNIGYSLLGRVIEKVTGRSYEEQLQAAIFTPLGMKSTGVDRPGASEAGRAVGYAFAAGGALATAEYSDTSRDPAAGGLYSTVEDMGKWLQALQAGRIVGQATLQQAFAPFSLAGDRASSYGYGFMLVPYRGLREIGHGGDISGFNTYVAVYPSEKLSVVVLSNVGMRSAGPLPTAGDVVHRIAAAVAGGRLGPEYPEVVSVPPPVLQGYVGRYRLLAPPPVQQIMGDAIEIRLDGGRLLASGKQGEAEIYAESPTCFFSKLGPVRISFTPGAPGEPTQAVLSLMGVREFRLQRMP